MELIPLNKESLSEYIQSEFYKNSNDIPISGIRALSQINNPRILDDDIILIVAHYENQLVAYLGVLPDDLFSNSKDLQGIHMGWLSCLWVKEDLRGTGVAKKLVMMMYELWQGKLIGTEFVPSLIHFYKSTNRFHQIIAIKGRRYYTKLNLEHWFENRYKKLWGLHNVLKIFDKSSNLLFDFLRNSRKVILSSEWNQKKILSDEHNRFILSTSNSNFFKRYATELNWIVLFPWLQEISTVDKEENRYYFSVYAKQFFNSFYELRNQQNEIIGLVLVHIRDGILKFPYVFLNEQLGSQKFINLIQELIHQHQISIIEFINVPNIMKLGIGFNNFIFSKTRTRKYVIGNGLSETFNGEIKFLDGDGDCAFV